MRALAIARLAALAGVCFGISATALASDTDSQPLFIILNGKRVPTMIIPPQARAARQAQTADFQVIQPGDDETGAQTLAPRDEDNAATGDADTFRDARNAARRRYLVGQYAGYPVSVPQYGPGAWYYQQPMPPQWYGDVIRERYRAQRWVRRQEEGRKFNADDMEKRAERVLASHEKALRVGLEYMKAANYQQAAIALQMAGELNQGDPACRIHLAQARMAIGHYEEAGAALRRALELQPRLVYVPLNLAAYYGNPADFDTQIDKLAQHVREARRGVDTWFLLGYMQYQRGDLKEAYRAFRALRRVMPDDSLTETFLELTKPPR